MVELAMELEPSRRSLDLATRTRGAPKQYRRHSTNNRLEVTLFKGPPQPPDDCIRAFSVIHKDESTLTPSRQQPLIVTRAHYNKITTEDKSTQTTEPYSDFDFHELTVDAIRKRLTSVGVPTCGSKLELVARLEAARRFWTSVQGAKHSRMTCSPLRARTVEASSLEWQCGRIARQ
jgi:hypothetical protein